jgi:membrane-associated phospholipid phosphatase
MPPVYKQLPFFSKGWKRLVGAFFLAVICGGGFVAISMFNVTRFGIRPLAAVQSFGWDAAVPFVSGWIWIYLLYYPFCFLPLLLKEVRNDSDTFTKTVIAFSIQFGISFAFFLLWPLRMIHPILPLGLNGTILHKLYGFDLGFNSFPSLHVANIVFVSLLFIRLRGRRRSAFIVVVAALIAMSTVLVKQHFVSDVLAGALLGWLSFALSETFVFQRAPDL